MKCLHIGSCWKCHPSQGKTQLWNSHRILTVKVRRLDLILTLLPQYHRQVALRCRVKCFWKSCGWQKGSWKWAGRRASSSCPAELRKSTSSSAIICKYAGMLSPVGPSLLHNLIIAECMHHTIQRGFLASMLTAITVSLEVFPRQTIHSFKVHGCGCIWVDGWFLDSEIMLRYLVLWDYMRYDHLTQEYEYGLWEASLTLLLPLQSFYFP